MERAHQLEGARQASTPLGIVITNSPFCNESEFLVEGVVAGFVRALNDLTKDPTKADVSITTDNCEGSGVLVSQRSAREHENEQAVGGLRNAARAVDRVPGWKLVGHKLSKLIEEVVSEFEDNLDKVLSGLGLKEQVEHVSEESCESLSKKFITCFGVEGSDLLPGPGGLIPRIFRILTPRPETLMFTSISG